MFEENKTYTEQQIEEAAPGVIKLGVVLSAIGNDNNQYDFHPSDRGYMLFSINNKEVNPIVKDGRNAKKKYFYITEEHIKLLSHFWINWELTSYGHGVPCIDIKRPYGNTYIISDIIDILGLPYEYDLYSDGYPDEIESKIRQLHHETLIALQILVRNAYIEIGEYVADKYDQNWKPVKEVK